MSLLVTPISAGQNQWTPIGPAGQDVLALKIFQQSILRRYAATRSSGVFLKVDGLPWGPASNGLPSLPVTSIALSPVPLPPCPATCTAPPSLLAGTDGAGVFASGDGGGHWVPSGSGLTSASIVALASAPGTNTAYAATSSGLFKTTDSAATWTPVGGLPVSVTAVEIDPLHPSTVYAGTTFSNPEANGSIFRSVDGGVTWTSPTDAFRGNSSVLALAIDPQDPTTLYASVSSASPSCAEPCIPPPPSVAYFLYKSIDSGSTWFEAEAGLGYSTRVASIAIDPTLPATVYAGGSGGVFRSLDGGASWSGYNAGLSDTNVQVLALDPTAPANVYAGTASSGVFVNTFSASGGCNIQTLCLVNGRFQVQVNWNYGGQILPGQAAPATISAGNFWFLTPDNLELTIKILDGRGVNGSWWVFVGALSNVEYTITVTDTVTLRTRTYFNPQGRLASIADTSAF
jgi:hypothetical protein